MKRQLFFGFILLAGLSPLAAGAQIGKGDRPTGSAFATRSPVLARNGMAATSHPLATQIALDILKQGGTAVDAALAANAALGLIEPNNCGIGGDLFALVWDPQTQRLHGLNASGRAPQGLPFDTLQARLPGQDQLPLLGPLSVSVPGAVDGWFMLHERFGRLPFDSLLAPSIRYARAGVPVAPVIAHEWDEAARVLEEALAGQEGFDNFRATFLPGGEAPSAGALFRNPDLARTYETIARGGRAAFYEGPIAARIAAFLARSGGFLSQADLAAHTSTWVTPVSVNYRGYDVFALPPNGQGLAVLQMLQILEGYDLAAMGPGSADYLHLLIEAKKLAFEDRARYYADPAFYDVPVETLLSDDYAAGRRQLIRMDQALQRLAVFDERLEQGQTVYLTVADASGMMVSLIQSNFYQFGSGLVPEGLGFVLQNRGSQFSLAPGQANVYAPGKRPFHTIIPGFVLKQGAPWLSFGVMGGAVQPQGQVQVLVNLIDFGMNVQEAGDAARLVHTGSSEPTGGEMVDGGRVGLERGIGAAVRAELGRRGHRLEEGSYFGGYQAIRWDGQVYWGASEMRKDGQAAGY